MPAALRLGPLLRYVDWETGTSATVWVEADRPCEAEVRCADGAGGTARTWRVAGHHYALVTVTGLRPGSETAYGVFLDGARVWPLPGSLFPESTIRTPAVSEGAAGPLRVTFGSCRWAAPPPEAGRHGFLHLSGTPGADDPDDPRDPPVLDGSPDAAGPVADPAGPDALDTLASALARGGTGEPRPDVLLLLGDQVYADKTSAAMRRWIARRRPLTEPPGPQVADYEEYTHLYYESWLDPEIRWLLSTVPSLMIFDDHDVIDDWNTSAAWVTEMRAKPWWRERVLGGLMSYWVHQHLGNLSPAELAADKLYQVVSRGGAGWDGTEDGEDAEDAYAPDGTAALREFAVRADADPAAARWSYRRDFGRVRLLVVDSRATRVLEEGGRAMLDAAEADWLRAQALDAPGSYDHLLIGTSLPWLLPPAVHDAEAWDAALCAGERGARWARLGERMRRRADLEHWAAFPASFEALTALIAEVGSGPAAPATIAVLSGDVHHSYIAEPEWPEPADPAAPGRFPESGRHVRSHVAQFTCSPVHNSAPAALRLAFRFGWSGAGRWLGRAMARHGRTGRPVIGWRRTGGPWFGNQLMTLTLRGRSARLRLDQARPEKCLTVAHEAVYGTADRVPYPLASPPASGIPAAPGTGAGDGSSHGSDEGQAQ
ncbi:alkaline phosphatase D family protein [Streptomyces albireticuli]|uniref:alkaline phosphatase D family protein n=1 Tax=Streptomyces albireticuli TaxID=1940 RepID=UPI0036A61898